MGQFCRIFLPLTTGLRSSLFAAYFNAMDKDYPKAQPQPGDLHGWIDD